MSRRLLALVLIGLGGWPGSWARAQVETLPPPTPETPSPSTPQTPLAPAAPVVVASPEACVPTITRTVTGKQVLLQEIQTATTMPKLEVREVEAGRTTTVELAWKEDRQKRTEMELRPRQVEQQVCVTTTKAVTTVDPCTGCPCTVYQQVPEVKTVTITVNDVVPVEREYLVKTAYLKPVDMVVKKLVLEASTVPAISTKLNAIETPYEVPVQVPACPLPCLH
jgi:hypothetical protein